MVLHPVDKAAVCSIVFERFLTHLFFASGHVSRDGREGISGQGGKLDPDPGQVHQVDNVPDYGPGGDIVKHGDSDGQLDCIPRLEPADLLGHHEGYAAAAYIHRFDINDLTSCHDHPHPDGMGGKGLHPDVSASFPLRDPVGKPDRHMHTAVFGEFYGENPGLKGIERTGSGAGDRGASRFRILSGDERRLDQQILILAVPTDKPAVIENDGLIYDNPHRHILLRYLPDVSVHLMFFAQDDEALFVVYFHKVTCFRSSSC